MVGEVREDWMEPLAILLSALAATPEVMTASALQDAYQWLKSAIQKKWQGHPDAPTAETALAQYEKDPETWKAPLSKSLQQFEVDRDEALVREAERLLILLREAQPGFASSVTVGKVTASRGSTINIAGGQIHNVSSTDPHRK